jgi:acyl carrier protein
MLDAPEVRQVIIDWLDDNLHFGDAASLITSDDLSFLDNGILDSLGFVRLVVHLEDRFGMTIDRKVLTRENFDSMNRIVRFVTGRTVIAGDA